MQSYLHIKYQVYLQAVRVHFSNLLEAESILDILIISVDNYTLRNWTEQGLLMANLRLFLFKNN